MISHIPDALKLPENSFLSNIAKLSPSPSSTRQKVELALFAVDQATRHPPATHPPTHPPTRESLFLIR